MKKLTYAFLGLLSLSILVASADPGQAAMAISGGKKLSKVTIVKKPPTNYPMPGPAPTPAPPPPTNYPSSKN